MSVSSKHQKTQHCNNNSNEQHKTTSKHDKQTRRESIRHKKLYGYHRGLTRKGHAKFGEIYFIEENYSTNSQIKFSDVSAIHHHTPAPTTILQAATCCRALKSWIFWIFCSMVIFSLRFFSTSRTIHPVR